MKNLNLKLFGLLFSITGSLIASNMSVDNLSVLSDSAKKLYANGELKTLTTLKKDNHFKAKKPALSMNEFKEFIKNDKQIEKLDYSFSSIDDVIILLDAIKVNKSLKSVKLNNPFISDGSYPFYYYDSMAASKYLSKVIDKNEIIEVIEMNFNYINDEGAKSISESLMNNKTLKSISLKGNYITEKGKKDLYKSISYRYLKYGNILDLNLELQNNDLKDDFQEFIVALVNMKKFL